MSRVYAYDGNALMDDMEALYGPPAPRFAIYSDLMPINVFWRDLDRDKGRFTVERVKDACETCPVRDVRGWPVVQQERLF